MATLAFLLDPRRPVPDAYDERWMATVCSWIDIANRKWVRLRETLPEDERRAVPRFAAGTGLSSNMADASLRKDPGLVENAEAWMERAWAEWRVSGGNAPLPVIDSWAAHEALNLDSGMSLAAVNAYYGGFTAVPASKLKRGGQHGFLKSEGDANAFAFGENDNIQRALFLEMARGHGGVHVALWTFGQALHLLVARSGKPGERPAVHGPFSVRARPANGAKRPGGFVEAIASALEGGAIAPDLDLLRRELGNPELSVAACFQAFGLPGALDFASPDIAARWDDLEQVGRALLTGEAVDKKALKRLNDALAPFGETKLPSKGKLGKGETARMVANATIELRSGMGVPEAGAWRERFRCAGFYWDICDGPALDRLTTGTDKTGVGTGASIARLLAHFPETLSRDPLFLATLALECEAANGHAFVDGLSKLAEQTKTASLVAVVARATERAAMRKAFGIEAQSDVATDGPWCGEALIGGTTIAKGDAGQIARVSMTKAKATGAVADLGPDGTVTIDYFKDGATNVSHEEIGLAASTPKALGQAAKSLSARDALNALGAGDVLAPGEWNEGSYSGAGALGEDHRAKKRRHVDSLAASSVDAKSVKQFSELLATNGHRWAYSGPLSESDGGFVTLRVVPGVTDEEWSRAVRNDLKGKSLISRYGDAWLQGTEVRGYSCSSVEIALVVQILGDAPPGTSLAVWVGHELKGGWQV